MRIAFTKSQWERISEVFGNLGLVSIVSVILPSILDKPNILNLFLGLLSTAFFWYISLITAKRYSL